MTDTDTDTDTGAVPRPRVVVHVAVSVDGATTGFAPDLGRFYELARTWREDVTLTGADTILVQEPALEAQPGPGPADGGPLLAVVDSRRRVRAWDALRDAGHWSAVVALRSRAGLADGEVNAEELVLGEDRVDLTAALGALGERGAQVVRVDSGGTLTGALLRAGLVDEISLLVHPCLAERPEGTDSPSAGRRWYGTEPPPASALRLDSAETFDGGVVWLRYRVTPHPPPAVGPSGSGSARAGD
jgi:2,5-diamino-6-(ribosylamino)-4(3H)-pyrimidinone 5'-phosphate reductase